jgi:hypothetical protein
MMADQGNGPEKKDENQEDQRHENKPSDLD